LKLKAEQANENISGAVDVKEDFEDDYLKYHEDAFWFFIDMFNNEALFLKIWKFIGEHQFDNILATLSLEFAETRGNLNKDQTFALLSLFQFAVSR